MEIDKIDGNDGHIDRLKKNWRNTGNFIGRDINETNFVQNITDELILLA